MDSDTHGTEGGRKFQVGSYNLTFPWFTYPRIPFSGYYNEEYFPELDRLLKFLDDMNRYNEIETMPTVFHIMIGAPVEELMNHTSAWEEYKNHYRQLVPIHLQKAAESGCKVISIVITPNDISIPHFMQQFETEDSGLLFEKTNGTSWKCEQINRALRDCDHADAMDEEFEQYANEIEIEIDWEIHWFRTMMPSENLERNRRMMDALLERKLDENVPDGIEKYRQTETDVKFVKYFYNKLHDTCKRFILNGSVVSCFNFAVFNADGVFTSFNNCRMLREIKSVFKDLKHIDRNKQRSSILMEWVFRKNNYHVYEVKVDGSDGDYGNTRICTNYVREGIRTTDQNEICNDSYPDIILRIVAPYADNSLCFDFVPCIHPFDLGKPMPGGFFNRRNNIPGSAVQNIIRIVDRTHNIPKMSSLLRSPSQQMRLNDPTQTMNTAEILSFNFKSQKSTCIVKHNKECLHDIGFCGTTANRGKTDSIAKRQKLIFKNSGVQKKKPNKSKNSRKNQCRSYELLKKKWDEDKDNDKDKNDRKSLYMKQMNTHRFKYAS
jgi:hypothetical protein